MIISKKEIGGNWHSTASVGHSKYRERMSHFRYFG